jgi:hypothetical protein
MPKARPNRAPDVFKKDVLDEISKRSVAGRAMNSGANRGDWLYAAAVRFFGSWGNAVDEAGIEYQSVKATGLSREELLVRIRAAAQTGPLFAREHRLLSSNARRLFKSWNAAVKAAGCSLPSNKKWSRELVVEAINDDVRHGLPVNSVAIVARNGSLYVAGRREFGSWKKALIAADPELATMIAKRAAAAQKKITKPSARRRSRPAR